MTLGEWSAAWMASHSPGWGWSLGLDAWVTLSLQSIASAAQMQLKSSEPKCSALERLMRWAKGEVRAELWVCPKVVKLL